MKFNVKARFDNVSLKHNDWSCPVPFLYTAVYLRSLPRTGYLVEQLLNGQANGCIFLATPSSPCCYTVQAGLTPDVAQADLELSFSPPSASQVLATIASWRWTLSSA